MMEDSPPNAQDIVERLDTEDVIELQAFSERKEWIEKKTKFLETLPPCDPFAGAKELNSATGLIPGLASREELERWFEEHDVIEREAEQFDTGDMKRFKAITKAAAQRNLTPRDTDVIEVTLNTLLALDRLLHLLRDRSEKLELLNIRLTWEEQRTSSWKEFSSILQNIRTFLATRARWSLDSYTSATLPQSLSNESLNIPKSDSETSLVDIGNVSRSSRYKTADALARDAIFLSTRIDRLKHSYINAAGKTLDRFIDTSRKPVPDELLDEQDRLELKAVNEVEHLGKFLLAVVQQWKKADEVYFEAVKDKVTLETLLTEIKVALREHPSMQRANGFTTRRDALMCRAALQRAQFRPDSSVLGPSHSLFLDQQAFNDNLYRELSAHLNSVSDLLNAVDERCKTYIARCAAVDEVSKLSLAAKDSSEKLAHITSRFVDGVSCTEGDGTSVKLHSIDCLEMRCHNRYLEVIPALVDEYTKETRKTTSTIHAMRSAYPKATSFPVDEKWLQDSKRELKYLETAQLETKLARDKALTNISTLQETRSVWQSMTDLLPKILVLQEDIIETMNKQKWKRYFREREAPPTPESPEIPPAVHLLIESLSHRRKELSQIFDSTISSPLITLRPKIPEQLFDHLSASSNGLTVLLCELSAWQQLWVATQTQSDAMSTVRSRTHELERQVEIQKLELDACVQAIVQRPDTVESNSFDKLLNQSFEVQSSLRLFLNGLVLQVPFVSSYNGSVSRSRPTAASFQMLQIADPKSHSIERQPFDTTELDTHVRSDLNRFSMIISGHVSALDDRCSTLHVASMFHGYAMRIKVTREQISEASHRLSTIHSVVLEQSSLDNMALLMHRDVVAQLITDIGTSVMPILSEIRDGINGIVRPENVHRAMFDALKSSREALLNDVQRAYDHLQSEATSVSDTITAAMNHIDKNAFSETITSEDNGDQSITQDPDITITLNEPGQSLVFPRTELSMPLKEAAPGPPTITLEEEDVFSSPLGVTSTFLDGEDLRNRIQIIRQRLQKLCPSRLTTASSDAVSSLPTTVDYESLKSELEAIARDMASFPLVVRDIELDTQLISLRLDVEAANSTVKVVGALVEVASIVASCDSAHSNLLEAIDRLADGPRSASQTLAGTDAVVEAKKTVHQLTTSTQLLMDRIRSQSSRFRDDHRVTSEASRLDQAWRELLDMVQDEGLTLPVPRPMSAASSLSSFSDSSCSSRMTKRSSKIAKPKTFLTPAFPSGLPVSSPRRAVSNQASAGIPGHYRSRPSSKASMRSVSGPAFASSSSATTSTFASRQRTTSTSSNISHLAPSTPIRSQTARRDSGSSVTAFPRSPSTPSRDVSRSSWSRTPRHSFAATFSSPKIVRRRTYVSNPKSKLDVAVGDIVNKLPMPVNIEMADADWKDQSGKYWIGDQDPKLCFCRILRSQTVMVRVGGGWQELSKFIKAHYADAFRLLSEFESPEQRESEKWISSSSLKATKLASASDSHDQIPRTPEPSLPSFSISSHNGESPKSLKSSPSSSSLKPIQFLRRADGQGAIPPSPSKNSNVRRRDSLAPSPSKSFVWRP